MTKPLSDDCREKLKAIEDDLLNIIRRRLVGGHVGSIDDLLKEAVESIKAKRSSTDEDCKEKLKEIEDELLLLKSKSLVDWPREIERLFRV